jgi:hypothetical protein
MIPKRDRHLRLSIFASPPCPDTPCRPPLYRTYVKPNIRSLPESELVLKLEDYLFRLRHDLGSECFPRAAAAYLEDWASDRQRWLRKYYAKDSDEPVFDITSATEQALDWLSSLTQPAVHWHPVPPPHPVRASAPILPAQAIEASATGSKAFEARYGLLAKLSLVRFRILDKRLAIAGLTNITVPVGQFADFCPHVARVFVVENEITGLAFPPVSDSMVVLGLGHAVSLIAAARWLHDREVHQYYRPRARRAWSLPRQRCRREALLGRSQSRPRGPIYTSVRQGPRGYGTIQRTGKSSRPFSWPIPRV